MNLQATSEVIESVHNLLINKVYNARCNEFLRTVTKLACIDKGKGIDGNVSLRDELKVCALKKMSDDNTIQWTLDYSHLDYPDPRLSGSRTEIIAHAV